MEVYAGFIAQTDFEVGRLLHAISQAPHADNTLILYIAGDKGSCAEGGGDGFTDALTSVPDQLKYIDDLGSPFGGIEPLLRRLGLAGRYAFQR